MKSIEYLKEIRKSEGLARAVLRKIVVERGEATFYLVTDANYSAADIARATEVSSRYAEGMRASVRVMKSVPSEEAVKAAVAEILRSESPSFAAFVDPADISVSLGENGGHFIIGVGAAERDRGEEEGVVDAVCAALARGYCGVWTGELQTVRKAEEAISHEAPPEEYLLAPRFFHVENYDAIDGGAPENAIYIADLTKEAHGVTVCGTVTHIEERSTKTGKPYFSVTVSDGSGTLRAAYFTKKATLEKVRGVRQGESVCLTGDNEFYNGGLSFRVKAIDRGTPPAGFVPEQRPSRPVPAQYRVVFPVPAADLVQADLFSKERLPEDFKREKFVVFDLETTGLSQGGVMDKIIEIGAVKIENGSISERFSTFVACPTALPAEIVKLTGITDEMLVGAPEIGPVIADFYKFTAGCSLVAHNTQFDCRIIKYYGEAEGYRFDRKQYDTLFLAQELLSLRNYKLNTIADYFGFSFDHHRAFEDAFVTAKIFIELIRRRGSLPK